MYNNMFYCITFCCCFSVEIVATKSNPAVITQPLYGQVTSNSHPDTIANNQVVVQGGPTQVEYITLEEFFIPDPEPTSTVKTSEHGHQGRCNIV
jgi:hypothetical protein